MRAHLLVPLVLALASGCKQFYTVDEACDEPGNVSGKKYLQTSEIDAVHRINCYRRLVGLGRANINELVVNASDDLGEYVKSNPEIWGQSDFDTLAYLAERTSLPGFTGVSVWERLNHRNYVSPPDIGIRLEELIGIVADVPGEPVVGGAALVDLIMGEHTSRELLIRPSWIDGAYTEVELDAAWWEAAYTAGGITPELLAQLTPRICPGEAPDAYNPRPTGGRLVYLLVLYEDPYSEHADKPILYPREDQKDVPLVSFFGNYSIPADLNNVTFDLDGCLADTVVPAFPVTIIPQNLAAFGAVAPATTTSTGSTIIVGSTPTGPGDPAIVNVSVQSQDDVLDTPFVNPGDDPNRWAPDAYFLENSAAAWPEGPYEPDTTYHVYMDYTSPDGAFTLDWEFTTAAAGATTAPVARRFHPKHQVSYRRP